MDRKVLVSYFSCSGVTKAVAETLAKSTGGDLFEIKPKAPYTKGDLNWTDKNSRSTLEMKDKNSRPEIEGKLKNMNDYQVVFVGFPIWWYVAPTIINTFLESYDFSGKIVIPFATSGGSGMGKTDENLYPSCSRETSWRTGKLISSWNAESEIQKWIEEINI